MQDSTAQIEFIRVSCERARERNCDKVLPPEVLKALRDTFPALVPEINRLLGVLFPSLGVVYQTAPRTYQTPRAAEYLRDGVCEGQPVTRSHSRIDRIAESEGAALDYFAQHIDPRALTGAGQRRRALTCEDVARPVSADEKTGKYFRYPRGRALRAWFDWCDAWQRGDVKRLRVLADRARVLPETATERKAREARGAAKVLARAAGAALMAARQAARENARALSEVRETGTLDPDILERAANALLAISESMAAPAAV